MDLPLLSSSRPEFLATHLVIRNELNYICIKSIRSELPWNTNNILQCDMINNLDFEFKANTKS